jgi:hypothetical protein
VCIYVNLIAVQHGRKSEVISNFWWKFSTYMKLYMGFMRELFYDFVTLLLINNAGSRNCPNIVVINILCRIIKIERRVEYMEQSVHNLCEVFFIMDRCG